MKTSSIKLAAGIAWATLAIAAAIPANARATTTTLAGYGTCTASYSTTQTYLCGIYFSYSQNIKLVNTACSSGGCSIVSEYSYVEAVYAAGRKPVQTIGGCNGNNNYYLATMGSCAC